MSESSVSAHQRPFTPQVVFDLLEKVRERKPLVHCVTNQVVMNFTANTLYALGASPLMSHAPEEATELSNIRANLLINIGTLTGPWVEDVHQILQAELKTGKKLAVLDPVGAGATAFRTNTAHEFLKTGAFRALRGNAFEIMALTGESARGQGVESFDEATVAKHAACALAAQHGLIVAVSGPTDLVTDGHRILILKNGHPLFTKVTGAGCALNAVIAAFIAVSDDAFIGTAAAIAVFNVAGEISASQASGPGSFATAFLDRLSHLHKADLDETLRAEFAT